MNDDKLAIAISKAQAASELLNNELLGEVIEDIQKELERIVFSTNDTIECERARYSHRAIDLIKARLDALVANGNVARREVEDKASGNVRKQFGIV